MDNKCFPIRTAPEFDVIVVGGGTTGVAAAIAAARHGARTAIIEYHGFLGGNATNLPAWMGFHNRAGHQIIGGIAYEIAEKMQHAGGATPFYRDPITSSVLGTDGNWVKIVCTRETKAAGVELALHSMVVDVHVDASSDRPRPTGVYVFNRGGLHFYQAGVVIDCTDTGEIAQKSGVEMVWGRESDSKTQIASWTVTVGNIDFDKLLEYFVKNPTEIRPFPLEEPEVLLDQMHEADVFVMGSFHELVAQAKADGLNLPRTFLPGVAFPPKGEIMHVGSRVEGVNPTDPAGYARAEVEGMRQTEAWMSFFHRYVPGGENARLTTTPSHIGIRETNHMVGEYLLTGDDLLTGKHFDDVIAMGGYHLDVHTPDHDGIETGHPQTYDIPYRVLLPQGVDGVLVAGRAISADHLAMSSTRVIPISMAQGQAAGTAAAMAVRKGIAPRDVSVSELQAQMRADGAILSLAESPSRIEFRTSL